MKKSLSSLIVLIATAMFSGCILSKTPSVNDVYMAFNEKMTFSVNVFPNGATYEWTMDEMPLSNTGKSYVYTAQSGQHFLTVKAKHIFGTDMQTWHILTNNNTIVNDVIISDITSSLQDPEIDWYGHHIAWANEEGVWIADIDPVTGDISPINGKGILADSTPSYQGMQLVANGPEWVMSQEGSEVIYPDSATTGSGICIGRVKFFNGQWIQSPVPGGLNRIPYFGSFDVNYTAGAVTSAEVNPDTMTGTGQIIRLVNNSETEVNLGLGSKGGRWIKGAEGIAYYKKVDGIEQAGYYLFSQGQTVQVTSNSNPKEQVWMFRSPEYNNELILTCIEKHPTFDEFAIYRSVNNVWQKVDSLQSPSNRKGISSPEPFWWNNKTYFFFIAERRPTDPTTYYDEVWIMAIDPQNPFSRMVSNSFAAKRTDPEVFYTTTEPIIYYTESRNEIKIMHKCATGLGQLEQP